MRFTPIACAAALGAALLAPLATPVAAFDLTEMTEDERSAFRDEVRAYLMDNPEVLMEAIAVLEEREAVAAAAADTQMAGLHQAALWNTDHSWVGGNPDGDITLVEFVDYRCSFCRRAHPEIAELIETDGNIRIITKEYPILGEQSLLASRFAIATMTIEGDEAYKQVSDALFTVRTDITPETLARLADTLGLDTPAIMAEMDSDATTDIIQANHALGQQLRITGTPTFIFNDQMQRGYAPLASMEQLVARIRDGEQ